MPAFLYIDRINVACVGVMFSTCLSFKRSPKRKIELMLVGLLMKSVGKREVSLVPGSWVFKY